MQSKKLRRHDGGLTLPEEIILEVLLRLPADALCRFRCVSKAWRALIFDPTFVAAQRSHAGRILVAVFTSSTKTEQHQLRLLDGRGNVLRVFDIRGVAGLAPMLAPTRHGLVLVDCRRQHGAMIIDPASGRTCTVDGTSYRTAPTDYSFGRAIPSGDYKVLRLDRSCCAVATVSGSGDVEPPTWRQRPWGTVRFCPAFASQQECKATVNGVLYFMPFVTSCAIDDTRIAAFDLESEEWAAEMIEGPALGRKEEGDQWSIALAELKGTLCMVHNIGNNTSRAGHYANIWLLTDHGRGIWVKEYTIRTPERYLLSTKPLDVLGDGTTLLLLNEFWRTGNVEGYDRYILQLYNSITKTFTDFMVMAEGFNGRLAFYTGRSLLSLTKT